MYLKKEERNRIALIDKKIKFPKGFEKFVDKIAIKCNLIIKTNDKYKCTNCHCEFFSNEKLNKTCKCPNCKNTYLVKSSKLKRYTFKEDLAIFDKVENYFVERLFKLESNYKNGNFKYFYYEWGRRVYDNEFLLLDELINRNVTYFLSGGSIRYKSKFDTKWTKSETYYNPIRYYDFFYYYPGNLKRILSKIEIFKYSQIWKLASHVTVRYDLIYLLKNYNYSIELLTKMKLYNLALCPKSFSKKQSFEQRFMGLTKDYLPFMIKNNITIDELETLSLLKSKDIELVRFASRLVNLNEIVTYIDIKKAYELTDLNEDNAEQYRDYLDMLKIMKYNMDDKNILYPKNIVHAHDKIQEEYNVHKSDYIKNALIDRASELDKNQFSDKKFIIFPVHSIEELEDESYQQHNCVKTYAEKIARRETDIYLMRLIKNKEKSLVTVEVKNKKVIQKRTKFNKNTTKEQDIFLKQWEGRLV